MSDDFDDLDGDDLFRDPASLLAIEQAVATAERNAAPQQQGQGQGKTGYHHAIASSARRGRGVITQNGSINAETRPSSGIPGLGMRPRPQLSAQPPDPRPPAFVPPATSTRQHSSVHHLACEGSILEEEDDSYGGPEFSVDEFGRYFESEVKDVRREALDVAGASATPTMTSHSGNSHAAGLAGAQAGKTTSVRSTLIGMPAVHPASLAAPRASQAIARPRVARESQGSAISNTVAVGTGFPAKRAFTRVPSQGGDARRHAIEAALSQGATSESQQQQPSRSGSQQIGGTDGARGRERPSVEAGVGNAEIEALRRQVAQMVKEKKEIEERERKATAELWRYQGEAKNVRLKAEEEKKHAEGKFTNLQKQLADMEELLKAERMGHKRALDTVQTDHAFKMHNEQSSHSKARFGTSQRTRSAQVQATPSRTGAGARTTMITRTQSQVPNIPYEYTPTRSPGKRTAVREKGKATKKGDMGPPPVPGDLNAGFMTPKPLTGSSRKARMVESKNKNTPDANFRGLHDAFASDLVSGSFKKQKTSMDGEAPMNTPSVFDRHDQDAQDYEMQETLFQPIGADVVEQDENMDSPEEDIIFEVNHIIFTHVYTPIWESINDSMKTMQRILTCHNPSLDTFAVFQEKCSDFLEACGEREALSRDYCSEVNQTLWVLLSVMIEAEEVVAPANIVSLLQLLTLLRVRVPMYADVFSIASINMPQSMLEDLISQYWPSTDAPSAASKSEALPSDGEPADLSVLRRAFQIELGYALCTMLAGVSSLEGGAPLCMTAFASSPKGVRRLISTYSPISVVVDALDLLGGMSCDVDLFRPLLSLKSEHSSQELDPKKPPLIDALCVYLKQDHPEASVQTTATIRHRVLSIICNFCRSHVDGLTLLGNSFHLIPSLIQLTETLANQIWGICVSDENLELHFGVLVAVITVLHMLIFPPDAGNESLSSVHLRTVIAHALESPKEYNGLHHIFITALGRISYAPVPEIKQWSRMQITTLRYLAQDLLSELLGGNQKEDDSIFALFVPASEESVEAAALPEASEGPNAEEEAESMARMEVIVIPDD